ncbi:MAG TPA: hypothetical protein VNE58_00110, partial [Casimicrobiaceae bacterium]|nr:hypothetical protein [Casimicrobiaceae bacterium]
MKKGAPRLPVEDLQTGAVRVLATTGRRRSAPLPTIPTPAALVYSDIFGDSWQIVMVSGDI